MSDAELVERVAAIWSEALESTRQITREDNFFQLGGDSVSATIVLFQVKEQFGVDLDPPTLFEASALADFCDRIRQAGPGENSGAGDPNAR